MCVVDLYKFEVEIKVPESCARDLGSGIPAQVTSNGKTYKAEVSAVSPEVVNGEVTARLRFADGQQPPGLRPNQRMSSRLVPAPRKNVLIVQPRPFPEPPRGPYATSAGGCSATRRPITAGASRLTNVAIVSGPEPGEGI